MDGKSQAAAAAASDMSLRTAREWTPACYRARRHRSGTGGRDQIRSQRSGRPTSSRCCAVTSKAWLEAKLVLEVLRTRYPDQFHAGQARAPWRGARGVLPAGGRPGREAAIDFTHGTDLGVTVGGEPFPHLLFEFVLSYSDWTGVTVAFGETFEALVTGVQGALWALGGVPFVSDNLSAATHELKAGGGRALTPRFGRCSSTTGSAPVGSCRGGPMKTASPSNAVNRSVDALALCSNDTDCIPAMKYARRAGLQVVLACLPDCKPAIGLAPIPTSPGALPSLTERVRPLKT